MFAPDLVVSEPRNRKSFTQSFLGELCLSAAMRIEINPGLKSTVAKHLLRDGVLSEIEQAISALQLGGAYAMNSDTAKAKSAYQNFLMLWKDADPDIRMLKQAKAEYAKLQ